MVRQPAAFQAVVRQHRAAEVSPVGQRVVVPRPRQAVAVEEAGVCSLPVAAEEAGAGFPPPVALAAGSSPHQAAWGFRRSRALPSWATRSYTRGIPTKISRTGW